MMPIVGTNSKLDPKMIETIIWQTGIVIRKVIDKHSEVVVGFKNLREYQFLTGLFMLFDFPFLSVYIYPFLTCLLNIRFVPYTFRAYISLVI